MALIVYITENCEADARNHGLQVDLERFRDRVEKSQSTSLFDPFPPPYLVKKKLGGRQGRLIADLRPVGDHAVIVFLAVLTRGSREYEDEFTRDPHAYGRQHFDNVLSDRELSNFVENRTKESPPRLKPDPTDAEYDLLYGAFAHHHDAVVEDMVCETHEWVEQVAQERISKQLVILCRPCLQALELSPGLHFIAADGKPGWGVWVLRSEGRLLLITPVTEVTTTEAEALARRIAAELEGQDATSVLRSSRRAYTAPILTNDDLWIDLEKEPVANMALSPEETEVLESARSSHSPFPLFINGRAGSGKSTILQYLFADLLFYYLTNPIARTMAPPIYLTANGELLRIARIFVERLLRSEATFTQQLTVDLVQENMSVLDESFRQFQPHLLSLVSLEERSRRFSIASRVDYAVFRRMWLERFGKEKRAFKEFGPDLSWHVIRSYIKGKSSETYLEPGDYEQLPENEITVTREGFKIVYDRVWSAWYQRVLEEKGLWDDQDLTRYILDNELAQHTNPAVFCDEAQDFTRLELELLLRLNLFSNRTLPPNDISRVPFAFAGDHFQTLNPTGFRWDTIKTSYVEKFIYELDPARRSGQTDLNYRELKYNYRSTHRIVRFGNHVQAMRSALFQSPDLWPQFPWTTEPHSFPVVWFRANDAGFWTKFRENAGFVLIIPCNEGEEADHVQNDPILREQIRTEDGVPLNVLSAARAKGCEYPSVIVYGFGSAANFEIISVLESESKTGTSNPDKSLPIQYFINRLYVAVSRAKRRLVIVDTEEGFARLWKCAQEEVAENLMLHKIKNGRQVWGNEIEGMTIGRPEELTYESAGDPLENARAFEADGLAREDAFLLKQAAQAYRSCGDIPKYRECRARALEAEGQLLEAGDAYFEAGFAVPEGVLSFWRAGRKGWIRLYEKATDAPQIQREIEFEWARGITEKVGAVEVAKMLNRFAKRLDDDPGFASECVGDPIWLEALNTLLQPLIDKEDPNIPVKPLSQLIVCFDRMRGKGMKLPAKTCATIYFLAKRHAEAVELWDNCPDAKPSEYFKAKASVEPYPQRILSLARLGLEEEIVYAYLDAPHVPLNPEQASAVVDALAVSNHLVEAFNLAWEAGIPSPMLRLAISALKTDDRETASLALHAGLIFLVNHEEWEPIAGFASSLRFAPAEEWKASVLSEFVRSESDKMQLTLVQVLARSEKLADAPARFQRQLTDFLRRYLRVKEGAWRGHLTILEAGSALERGGRFTDAIAFYEAVLKARPSDDEKQFARRRFLVGKQRQVKHERLVGDTLKVAEILQELRRDQASWRIGSLEELPTFPELPPLQKPGTQAASDQGLVAPGASEAVPEYATTQSSDHVVITGGLLKIEGSRKNNRCNITHTETMETAFVKIGERKCGGEVDFNQADEDRWVCESWKLTVRFSKNSGEFLSIHTEESGLVLTVRP